MKKVKVRNANGQVRFVSQRVAEIMEDRHGAVIIKDTAEVTKAASDALKETPETPETPEGTEEPELSLADLKKAIKETKDSDFIEAALKAEFKRERPRTSVIEAGESRLAELKEEE